jgi:hypothetical protein
LRIENPHKKERAVERAIKRRREQEMIADTRARVEEPLDPQIEIQNPPLQQQQPQAPSEIQELQQQYQTQLSQLNQMLEYQLYNNVDASIETMVKIKQDYQAQVQLLKRDYITRITKAMQQDQSTDSAPNPQPLRTLAPNPQINTAPTVWSAPQSWTFLPGNVTK